MLAIRYAQIKDAKAIAKVHVHSWRVIYRGHIPDHVLDNLSIIEREKNWIALLQNNANVLVLEDDHQLVGFVSFCPSRDQDADPVITAEISAIYLMPNKWRKGFGKLLLNAAIDEIIKLNYSEVSLWVLDNNQQAKKFYENMGFIESSDTKIEERIGYTLHETRYRKKLN